MENIQDNLDIPNEWDVMPNQDLLGSDKKTVHSFTFNHSSKNVLICNKGKPKNTRRNCEQEFRDKIDLLLSEKELEINLSVSSLDSLDSPLINDGPRTL